MGAPDAGDEWERRLHERLRWADAVACVVTSAFVRSPWCTGEVAVARSRGCRLIPLQAEPETTHPLLGAVQHIDCRHGPEAVRAALTEALRLIDAAGGVGWPDGRSPFPGLRAFAADQHQVFFGRAAEVNELGGLLRSPAERADAAVLLVVGPSGCGKSSLARAGLLPAMANEPGWWTLPPMLPGTDPEAALVREFAAGFRAVGVETGIAELRTRLDGQGLATLVDELLHAAPGPRRQRLLLVIDQFEELLTQTDPDRRARFADLLRPLAGGPLRVVGTLRPEFLDPLLVCPELAGLSTHTYTVRPLGRDALPSVIEDPARLAGMGVDDDLVARLVADTDGGTALPLLAYTLAQLAEGVGRGGRLQLARYEQLGGVQGTLARQADAALAAAETAGGRGREDVLRDLLRLVTVDEHGRPTRWRVPAAELPAAELEPFVTRRLLITDQDGGDVVVEVAHEAILNAWAPLARAVEVNTGALRARRGIEEAAAEWVEQGRPTDRLWERGQLAAAVTAVGARVKRQPAAPNGAAGRVRARRTIVAERVELSAPARQFLLASTRTDRRRRGCSTAVLVGLLVLALAAAAFAAVQLRVAEQRQQLATARLLIARAEAVVAGDPRTALLLGEAAVRIRPDPEIRSGLAHLVDANRFAGRLTEHQGVQRALAFAPDRPLLATGADDGQVLLWGMADPGRPRRTGPALSVRSDVMDLAFRPVGGLLAAGALDGTISIWNVADPAAPVRVGEPLRAHPDEVNGLAFTPDGHTLVSFGIGDGVRLSDLSDPERPRAIGGPLPGHTDDVADPAGVAMAPNAPLLAVGTWDDTVVLWDLADPSRPRRLEQPLTGHQEEVSALAFAPNGRVLAGGSSDDTVLLWDVTDPAHGKRIGEPLPAQSSVVNAVGFSPDGRVLATHGPEGGVSLWDVDGTGTPTRRDKPLIGHSGVVMALAFTADGRTLATAGSEGTTALWDLGERGTPRPAAPPLAGHERAVRSVGFAPDDRALFTAGSDDTVRRWDVSDRTQPVLAGDPLVAHSAGINQMAMSPDGQAIVVSSSDHGDVLWHLDSPDRPWRIERPGTVGRRSDNLAETVAFSADGRVLATGSWDDKLLLWDVSGPGEPRLLGAPLAGHRGLVSAVAFAPAGDLMVTGGRDEEVLLWDVSDPARPRRVGSPLTAHSSFVMSLAFAPDAPTLMASGSWDGTTVLWDLTDPTHPRRIGEPLVGPEEGVNAVAFAPDGRTVATAGVNGTTLLWDLTDPDRPRRMGEPLSGQGRAINAVAFSHDGNTLATAGEDGTAVLWDMRPSYEFRDQALARACAATGGGFDPSAWSNAIPDVPYSDPCPSA